MSTANKTLTVGDVALGPSEVPVVGPKTYFKRTLEQMSRFSIGIVCVVDETDGQLLGIVTDGDVRRMLLRDQKPFPALFVDDTIVHATKSPTTVLADEPLADALSKMEQTRVWDMPVVDDDNRFIGLLHLFPALQAVMKT